MGGLLFGVSINQSAAPDADPVAEARRAEDLGFDFVSVTDHLHGTRPTHETWTLLTWIAASTARVGLVTDVLGLPYRAPSVMAKMAASLDLLSGGRLTLGLGAGGSDEEFLGYGLPLRSPGEKIEALAEAIEILRGMWTTPSSTFQGKHFRTEGAELEPKPDRPILIWLGTYGNRALELTGRAADGWIPSYPFAPPDVVPQKMERIRRAAEAAGRDPTALTYAYNVGVRVDEQATPRPGRMVSGGPDRVAEALAGFARIGFTAFNLWPVGDTAEQQERLAREVVPIVRASSAG
ncbi:MAG: LLM class flavin-dependent oxidoreductase [Actinomycetota bacterium]|nr:LLM class flavin-dependent oxidoreductase [Actinomycetota bacterium]